MELYYLVIYCVLFTTAASISSVDAISDDANDSLVLNAQGQNCNCENGRCFTDKEGHTKCTCKPGFALQDEFTCKPCDCGSLGKCIFVLKPTGTDQFQYQKKCVCDKGCAEKDGVCVDCFCGDNSACDFDYGERRCYCIEGYSEKDGVCTRCDCGFYGKCKYQNGNKICECDDGYLELNGICTECDCGEYGSCSFENGQKTCKCQRGFSVSDGKCEPCDCGEYGTCSLNKDVKTCVCQPGFSVNNGKCQPCDCGDSGTCSFQNGQKTCSCQPGFNVNNGKCEQCDCGDHGTCAFQNGQKTCTCQSGFNVNNGKCETCDCGLNSEYCGFVNGVKQCKCKDGHADRYGTCEECYCGANSRSCNFNNNQKTCSCLEGYVQKGETCELGCSTRNPCQNGGYCKEGFCFCQKGTRGEFCELIDECSTLCPNTSGVQCAYDVSSQRAYCKCLNSNLKYNPNTRQCGSTCQTDRECVNGVCRNGACQCLPGTWGDRCENVDCVSGAITCMDQIYLIWRGWDTLYLLWKKHWTLMKFVRENVVLPYVSDCQYGTNVKCNHLYDVLWCHQGHTIYVPTALNRVLRYRRVDATGAKCSNNLVPRAPPNHQSEQKSEFKQIGSRHYVNYVDE